MDIYRISLEVPLLQIAPFTLLLLVAAMSQRPKIWMGLALGTVFYWIFVRNYGSYSLDFSSMSFGAVFYSLSALLTLLMSFGVFVAGCVEGNRDL